MILYARGIVGPKGRIIVVDAENKRASIFADQVPGGYKVIDLAPPFTPDRYYAAIIAAQERSDITVVDSMSHEWEGPGGVLDWQEQELDRLSKGDADKAQQVKMLSWSAPKQSHKRLMRWLAATSKPLILCFRAEHKTHFDEDTSPPLPDAVARQAAREERRRRTVVKDRFTTPIGAKELVWDCLITYEMVRKEREGLEQGGFVIARKWTHPDLMRVLPKPDEQVSIKHGEALAAWCSRAAVKAPPASPPAGSKPVEGTRTVSERDRLLGELRSLTREQSGWDGKAASWPLAKQRMQQWLIDEGVLGDTQILDTLTDGELAGAVQATKTKLQK